MLRVSLVTCVWQRRELTRAFWTWCNWLQDRWARTHGISLTLVTAASNEPDRDLARAHGALVVMHDNAPLGGKFNAALQAARDTDPAQIMIMGSDDFFCEKTADALGDAIVADRTVGFKDLYYFELMTGQVRYLPGYRNRSRFGEPVGPGTTHRREVLDTLNWRLWDATRHHGMDHSRFATLKAHNAMPDLLHLRELDAVMVDVKSPVNLWPFDRTKKQPVFSEHDGKEVLGRLPAHVLAALPQRVELMTSLAVA